MANAILDLQAANEKISLLQKDVEAALALAANSEAKELDTAKKLEEANKTVVALQDELACVNKVLDESKAAQVDFEKKAAARAQEIVASVGVPPVTIAPATGPSKEDEEKKRISGLKGLAKVEACFKAKSKK